MFLLVFNPPIIDPKYLSHSVDVEVLLKGLRIAESIYATYATSAFIVFRAHGGLHLFEEFLSPNAFGSDDFF